MEKDEALARLRQLQGKDLRALADSYGVTVFKGDKLNKGWAGHTLEHYLGLPPNSFQRPDGGTWELKLVPLVAKSGNWVPKETMAITMIKAGDVAKTPFEESHLLAKLQSLIICGRGFVDRQESTSTLIKVASFDKTDASAAEIFVQVKADYLEVQRVIVKEGFQHLTGWMGTLVQPRTKGQGHGSTSRAFYARKTLVSRILGLD